jgi:hypothetical protein
MTDLVKELFRRNNILAWLTLGHVLLLIILAIISLFDSTTILGINRWIKPMKFSASIALYAATAAWFTGYLPENKPSVKWISWGIAVCMIAEIVCIVLQPARGTTSHFNRATPFDGVIFSIMGAMIVINTVLDAFLLVLFFKEKVAIPESYLWGIRLGLAVFIIAALEGIVMIIRLSHSVGVADGGAGLPFVNWSTQGGDLRIAHFFGLHALQALPIAGYIFHKLSAKKSLSYPVAWTWIFAFAYTSIGVLLLMQAMQGKPLY